MKTKYNTHRV